MDIPLGSELELALTHSAQRAGVSPQELAVAVLRERFLCECKSPKPHDEWEHTLLAAAVDCGVSLPDAALGSEGLYE